MKKHLLALISMFFLGIMVGFVTCQVFYPPKAIHLPLSDAKISVVLCSGDTAIWKDLNPDGGVVRSQMIIGEPLCKK